MESKLVRKCKNGLIYYRKHGFLATIHQVFIDDYTVHSKLPPEKYERALKRWYRWELAVDRVIIDQNLMQRCRKAVFAVIGKPVF